MSKSPPRLSESGFPLPGDERAFCSLLDVLPAAAYLCDAEGLITYFNAPAARIWGREPRLLDPADRYCGSFRLFYPDGRSMRHDECWMALALREGKGYNGHEVVIECQDGRRVTALAHANPLRDEAGRLTGALNVLVDITDQKAAEVELRDAVRRRTDFLATLSHELRNPLAPIQNALEILRHERTSPEAAERALASIDRQFSQLTRLVGELLDISRVERDKLALRLAIVPLEEVVRTALESASARLDERDQRLDVRLPEEPLPIFADAVRLAQILQNLLDNASKYSPDGSTVRLGVRVVADDVVFEVEDEGVGIPATHMESIFEPFAQLDQSLERENSGLGIGLTLVKRLAELHGGSVRASARDDGEGSRFMVTIPRGPEALSPELQPAPRRDPGGSLRVLVADDNRDAADTLAELLHLDGHSVEVVYDGGRALDRFQELDPQVVILDIAMPGMSGYDTAREIRQRAGGSPPVLIAITGYGQAEDVDRGVRAGFDHFLVKPADASRLRQLLEGVEAGRR